MSLKLTATERGLLAGEGTRAEQLAMQLLTKVGEGMDADRFLSITHAHIDSCLFHGQAGLDFARMLVEAGGKVAVPTTLNVSSLDLLHPDLYRGDPDTAAQARELMDIYVQMGGQPTWTCTPYQSEYRPRLGEHVAWAESNAIVFANSVLGARTDRYGDFTDIAAAIVGRVPEAGLHLSCNRWATVQLEGSAISSDWLSRSDLPGLVGFLAGKRAGSGVPVLSGLERRTWTEDDLKMLGAAAASSGAVGLFHLVGVTPEAPTLSAVLPPHSIPVFRFTDADLEQAREELSGGSGQTVQAVSIGTPHASATEIRQVWELLAGRRVDPDICFFLSTSRAMLDPAHSARTDLLALKQAGVQVVVDTCTYITPILSPDIRVVLTNSVKWAYYAPGNLGVSVILGTLEECVETAVAGQVP